MATLSDAPVQPVGPIVGGGFTILRRAPIAALRGCVLDIAGYREHLYGHFRQIEVAALVVPFIISVGDPFSIALGRQPSAKDHQPSFAAGLYAGPVVIDSSAAANVCR
ncbi:hypothetical protein [Mesorhizobium sp. NBSH29]|uniref:hypothetical protein n=1 Tax=Mesorhizobium sp. NBSH29 TaxID=2654249 RepID=UPI0027E469F2|nr:hypothetical protein [Mesorhizobium sp. NBSH29]